MEEIVEINQKEEILEVLNLFSKSLHSLERGLEYRDYMAEKFSKYAHFIVVKSLNDIIGFAAFYCNDLINKNAFLSMIAIREPYKKKGYGSQLLRYIYDKCKENSMSVLKLEVDKDNVNAFKFYKNHGFNVVNTESEKLMVLKQLE